MSNFLEIIKADFYALKQLAYQIALIEGLSDNDKYRLNNAIKGCHLLLIVLEDGSPEVYQELQKDYDAMIAEIKGMINPSEYGYISSLFENPQVE